MAGSRESSDSWEAGNGTTTSQGVPPENDPGSSIGVSYQF
jgi:hypothetical protein